MNIVVGIIPLIIVLIIVFICVRTLRQALSVPSKHRGAATCGQCSYEIADLSFDRCPECGGKLLEVGIVTPALTVRRGSSVVGLISTWTALVAIIALASLGVVGVVWSVSDANLPRGANTDLQQAHSYRPTGQSLTQDYSVTLDLDVITNATAEIRSGTIDLGITRSDQSTGSLKLDATTLEVLSADGSQSQAPFHEFSLDDVGGMYESVGLDVTDDIVAYEAAQFFEITTDAATYPFVTPIPSGKVNPKSSRGLRKSGGGSWQSPAPPAPVVAGLNREDLLLVLGGGFWLVVYVVGLRLMLLGRKRALQQTA